MMIGPSEAAAALGRIRTPKKAAASRVNGTKGGAHEWSEETRAKLRAAQQVRRDRERAAREAAGLAPSAATSAPIGAAGMVAEEKASYG